MSEIRVVIQKPSNSGGLPEAPNDGEQYGRQNETWTPISQTGGGVDSVSGDGVGGTPTNVVMSFPTASDLGLTTDNISDSSDFGFSTQTDVNNVVKTGLEGNAQGITDLFNNKADKTALASTDAQVAINEQNIQALGDTKVDSVIAGANVEVNNIDPKNPIVSAFPTTTAGLLDRTYFTGDEITTSEGTFYKSNRDNKGTVASVAELAIVNDGQKEFFLKDLLSEPYPIDTTIYKGSYSGVINGIVDSNSGEQKFYVEIYKTDINGLPINSGIAGQPIGDLGVTVIAIAESGLIDLQVGNETTFSVTAQLEDNLSLLTTNRIRYHVGVEKISNQGGNVAVTTYYGSNHVAHIDIPVKALTNTVINTDLTEFPSSATQYDINRGLKTGVANNAIEIVVLEGSKVSSLTDNEPTGSDIIFNIVSLTQAEYDAGTPIATTLYLITDA